MNMNVHVFNFYNDPAAGFRTVGGQGVPNQEIMSGEGLLCRYREDGSGYAVLCRREMVGERVAQRNTAISWEASEKPPVGAIPSIRNKLEKLANGDAGPQQLTIQVETAASAPGILLATMLQTLDQDTDLKLVGWTEQQLLGAISRADMTAGHALTIGLPLPGNCKPCDFFTVNPQNEMSNASVRPLKVLDAGHVSADALPPDMLRLAEIIGNAPAEVVKLAGKYGRRAYVMYGSLMYSGAKVLPVEASDSRLLHEMLALLPPGRICALLEGQLIRNTEHDRQHLGDSETVKAVNSKEAAKGRKGRKNRKQAHEQLCEEQENGSALQEEADWENRLPDEAYGDEMYTEADYDDAGWEPSGKLLRLLRRLLLLEVCLLAGFVCCILHFHLLVVPYAHYASICSGLFCAFTAGTFVGSYIK